MADWQRVIDVIRAQGWWFDYTTDGSSVPLPELVREVFDRRGESATTLRVRLAGGILVNTHFFAADEIEFDFDPRELQGQDQVDACHERF